jgi:hypothetical protein
MSALSTHYRSRKCNQAGIEALIKAKLSEHEAGVPASELCRKHGIATSISWKKKPRPLA